MKNSPIKLISMVNKIDFNELNKLDETQQIEQMKSWNENMWIQFRMQNTISEREVFDPILTLIESDFDS